MKSSASTTVSNSNPCPPQRNRNKRSQFKLLAGHTEYLVESGDEVSGIYSSRPRGIANIAGATRGGWQAI